jgi:hypothetical protein
MRSSFVIILFHACCVIFVSALPPAGSYPPASLTAEDFAKEDEVVVYLWKGKPHQSHPAVDFAEYLSFSYVFTTRTNWCISNQFPPWSLMMSGGGWAGFTQDVWRTPNYLGHEVRKKPCEGMCVLYYLSISLSLSFFIALTF